MFIRDNYYGFFHLARALRKRGWDAISVTTDDPDGPFLHGSDLVVHDPDPKIMQDKLKDLETEIMRRFAMIYFYNARGISLYPEYGINPGQRAVPDIPPDIARFKAAGKKIGTVVTGCLEVYTQSTLRAWSGVCDRCYHSRPGSLCSDAGNAVIGDFAHRVCDIIEVGTAPWLDYAIGSPVSHVPLTSALDSEYWSPDLEIPAPYRIRREPGELLVLHAFGNDGARSDEHFNIKGTPAIRGAIESLRSQGVLIRLIYVNNVPSTDMRFLQLQADIVVDQLNMGFYGAAARESMMLGRPVVGYVAEDMRSPNGQVPDWRKGCPIIPAREDTILAVLRQLAENREILPAIGASSRAYAMRWHSADACAERFEAVYDRVMAGEAVE